MKLTLEHITFKRQITEKIQLTMKAKKKLKWWREQQKQQPNSKKEAEKYNENDDGDDDKTIVHMQTHLQCVAAWICCNNTGDSVSSFLHRFNAIIRNIADTVRCFYL